MQINEKEFSDLIDFISLLIIYAQDNDVSLDTCDNIDELRENYLNFHRRGKKEFLEKSNQNGEKND